MTGDIHFLKHRAWPFLLGVAEYWQAWLHGGTDGRLHVRDSTAHEDGPWGLPHMMRRVDGQVLRDDPVQDIANLHVLFSAMSEFARTLGHAESAIAQWSTLANQLTPLPELRLADGTNAYCLCAGIDHIAAPDHVASTAIFPGLRLGMGSSPAEISKAHAMLEHSAGWRQMNAFCQVLPAAVRVGYPGATDKLRSAISDLMQNNGLVVTSPHHGGIETCGTVCAVDDLLVQEQHGILRLFPVWDRSEEASFSGLRTAGAFVVSARCRSGRVDEIELQSDHGGLCRMVAPHGGTLTIEDQRGNRISTEQHDGVTTFLTESQGTYRISEQ